VLLKAKGIHIGHIIASALFSMGLSFMALHSFLIIKGHIAVLALPYLLLTAAPYFAKEIHQLQSSAYGLIKVAIL
jgi:hypothetical protein